MDAWLIILIVFLFILVASLPITNRIERGKYMIIRDTLSSMKRTGNFDTDNKFAAALTKLNITTSEQLDRYIAFHYRDAVEALERQKTHIFVVATILALVFMAQLFVPAIVSGDPARRLWVDRLYVPLNQILLGIFVLALSVMLVTRSSAKKIMWLFWEYLQ